jgi:hypothetical protein
MHMLLLAVELAEKLLFAIVFPEEESSKSA